ncbi:MAG: flagellar hook capping FlgD N-terminal domain-containing protein [Actinomycetota bacterium]
MQTNLNASNETGSASASSSILGNGAGAISDLFTKLLVAQIKNQDPLDPADPSQFVNQLAQLSQVESLSKLASQNTSSAALLQSMQAIALGGQVGSQVRVRSDQVALGSEPVQGGFTLQDGSSKVALVLTGADGSERRLELGTRDAGEVNFTIDPAALGLSPGRYALRVDAANHETPAVEIAGQLSSVKLSPTGSPVLTVANVGEVLPAAITQFNGRQTTPAN